MKKTCLYNFFLQLVVLASFPVYGQGKFEVKVHPGTELLHIVNYLAEVYEPIAKESTYVDKVNDWFGKYRDHPAIEHASKLPYNDFADLGWCMEGPAMDLYLPESYGYLERILPNTYLEEYLKLSRQFALDTDFQSFYQLQEPNYTRWEGEFTAALAEDMPLSSLADFYQVPFSKVIYFSISPMGGSLKANLLMEEINPHFSHYAPVIIPFDLNFIDDKSREPNFAYHQQAITNSVWHEVSHIYWEEINTAYREEIGKLSYQDPFRANFNTFQDSRLNTYYFVHELIADGVAIYLKKQLISEELAEKHLNINEGYGCPLFREFIELLDRNYWDNRQLTNFQAFIPEIIQMINESK